ncbi:molybdopterin molybdotransferase MoeA [Limnobacter humi]|uniref:Molybdopterin molybdenumtransferase n=1 Tax=Limnobacter humi TaxID=1778671 RepID=A0ABT1WI24_9BURK|nr:gephyrin-like molybdotransferase Glp [Limnobacter humi]MCQ8897148.1 molybdopterin molybdotransferase MoeA [Limnobacter humi]
MIELDDLLMQLWPQAQQYKPAIETLPLQQVYGRVLADSQHSAIQVPQHDNSGMDGYAVRCADFLQGMVFPVSQRIPAGKTPQPLEPGTVARIFTGAPIPPGADAIVMQEDTVLLDDGRVHFNHLPKLNAWIRRAGEDIARGQVVVEMGATLNAVRVALLASIGIAEVPVYRPLRAGVMVTGSELKNPGSSLEPGQIYNSNEFVWLGLLKQMGCEVRSVGIVPDNLRATVEALKSLSDCDLVISSGGVSVGEEDHVKPAVEQVGELQAWKIAMKPGKPMAFGKIDRAGQSPCWFFGLPGNPVSSALAFQLVVKPFVDLLSGQSLPTADWRSRMVQVTAQFEWLRPDTRRDEFLRVRVESGMATLFANQSSGVLTSLDQSTGVVRLKAGQTVTPGDALPYVSYQELMK